MRGPLSVVPEVPLHWCTSIEQSSYLGMPTISIANRDATAQKAGRACELLCSGFSANLRFTLLTDCRVRVCPVSVGNMRRARSFPKPGPYVPLRFVGVVSVKCSELNVQTNHWNPRVASRLGCHSIGARVREGPWTPPAGNRWLSDALGEDRPR